MKRRIIATLGLLVGWGVAACDRGKPHTQPKESAPSSAPPSSAPAAPAGPRVTADGRYKVIEEEVEIDANGRKVRGTLSRPDGPGKWPALMLIAGSGPTDRNWESRDMQGANGSGRFLAQELTKRGIVVLRYDKMGAGKFDPPTKMPITIEDIESEPRAALAYLRGRTEADADQVFVGGHSEGGIYAVRLVSAEGAPKVAGLLLLSSAGRPMRDIIFSQITAGAHAQALKVGVDAKVVDEQLAPVKKDLDDFFAGTDVSSKKYASLPIIASIFSPVSRPATRVLYAYDPAAGLAKLAKMPVLVLNGEKDIQVSPTDDAKRLADAATKGGADLTFFLAPDANHPLKHEDQPIAKLLDDKEATVKGYNADGKVLDPKVLEAIVSFLRLHTH